MDLGRDSQKQIVVKNTFRAKPFQAYALPLSFNPWSHFVSKKLFPGLREEMRENSPGQLP